MNTTPNQFSVSARSIKSKFLSILTSAYLSAMLASSVALVRSDAPLAATIDQMTAQKALRSAVNGLNAASWSGSVSPEISAISEPTAKFVAANSPPDSDLVMTEELMARMIKRTLASKADYAIPSHMCAILGVCKPGQDMPARQILHRTLEGKHYFMVPTKEGSNDIFLAFASDTATEVYLTDKTGVLRAAAVASPTGLKLITNEQAAEKYKTEMQLFAKIAKTLPAEAIP